MVDISRHRSINSLQSLHQFVNILLSFQKFFLELLQDIGQRVQRFFLVNIDEVFPDEIDGLLHLPDEPAAESRCVSRPCPSNRQPEIRQRLRPRCQFSLSLWQVPGLRLSCRRKRNRQGSWGLFVDKTASLSHQGTTDALPTSSPRQAGQLLHP